MASTHLSLHYHIVFGTKDHAPTIAAAWRADLHAFMGGILRDLGGFPENIGGVADHVHLLIGLRATHSVADTLRELKTISSRWVHDTAGDKAFAWQEGYAAFTVSASNRIAVTTYIAHQEAHHRKQTFREEYHDLLVRSGIEFDPRYLS